MKVVFFIDDVNMPAREKYGAQPPIELLRQFQDFRGMYDRKQLFWRDIEDVTLCAACGPPGGGRQEVSPRYVNIMTSLFFGKQYPDTLESHRQCLPERF
jgi:dynein heavy chain